MAELPQVPIQTETFQERELHVPVDTRPEAIRNTALIADRAITNLSAAVERQRRITQDRQSLNEFYTKTNDLQQTIVSIKDPKEAASVRQTGMQDILAGIRENYPDMSPLAESAMLKSAGAQDLAFNMHQIKQAAIQDRLDTAAAIADGVRLATDATNHEEGLTHWRNTMDFIDTKEQTGGLSKIQADRYRNEVTHAYRLGQFANLVASNPAEALGMSQAEAGIGGQEYRVKQAEALQRIEDKIKLGGVHAKEEKRNYENMALAGQFKDNPAALEALHTTNMISHGVYVTAKAFIPPDQRSKAILENILKTTPWEGADEVKTFQRDWIMGNNTLSADEHAYLSGQVQEKISQLKDPQFLNGINLFHALKDYGYQNGQFYLMHGYPGSEGRRWNSLMQTTFTQLDHAKSMKEQQEIFNEAMKQTKELFHVGERIAVHKAGQPAPEIIVNHLQDIINDAEYGQHE